MQSPQKLGAPGSPASPLPSKLQWVVANALRRQRRSRRGREVPPCSQGVLRLGRRKQARPRQRRNREPHCPRATLGSQDGVLAPPRKASDLVRGAWRGRGGCEGPGNPAPSAARISSVGCRSQLRQELAELKSQLQGPAVMAKKGHFYPFLLILAHKTPRASPFRG